MKRIWFRYQDMKMYFLLIYFLLSSSDIEAKVESHECTFSFIPFLTQVFPCRTDEEQTLESLRLYWESEDDAELCHYFYFPLADPSSTRKFHLIITKLWPLRLKRGKFNAMGVIRIFFGKGGRITKRIWVSS